MKKMIILFCFSINLVNANNLKISNQLAKELQSNDSVDMYLLLKNTNNLKPAIGNNRIERIRSIVTQLKNNTNISKSIITPLLKSLTSDYKFYWINNSLHVKLPSTKARLLLKSPNIDKAYSNKAFKLKTIETKKSFNRGNWNNIAHINAPNAWSLGYTGQNILIAGQDTGYQWDHISLKESYAGWDNSNNSVDHNYNWHDSIHNPTISCSGNFNSPESCDDHGHGTHTMGTMIGGNDNQGNPIGVAPDAKWIGCRNMDSGKGTPSTYTECFQFFLEPTDLNGSNGDISKAPHIINNSWGCPLNEGCSIDALESVVNNTVAAGILVVSAAGNDGPGCNTINTPTAIYSNALTIGSTTLDDSISLFSSQGAVTVDGSNRIKPDMVAPGSNILSAELNGSFTLKNGTSMAAPHVTGVAALMLSANPNMIGKPKIIKQVLMRTSHFLSTQQSCSAVLGNSRPNNTFGWGRLDALAAVNQIKDIIFMDNLEDNF